LGRFTTDGSTRRHGGLLLLAGLLMACCSGPSSQAAGDGTRGLRVIEPARAAALQPGLAALGGARQLPIAVPLVPEPAASAAPSTSAAPTASAAPSTTAAQSSSAGESTSTLSSDWTLTSASTAPASAGSPVAHVRRTFVVLGDSLSTWAFAPGFTHPSDNAWPRLLAALDPDLMLLHNSAVPGNTTAQMLARFRQDVLAYRPDVLFVMGGTNDVANGRPTSTTVANLRTIVESAKAAGIRVVLLTIPPNDGFGKNQLKKLRSINAALKRVGASERIAVVDAYQAVATSSGWLRKSCMAYDRLHLSQRGEEAVAAAVYERLSARPTIRRAV
jgi:lysophospholipase L1-like esterase